jgi:hypothetical protein
MSPLWIAATATSKAAAFSRTVPKSGMVFTANPLLSGCHGSVRCAQ